MKKFKKQLTQEKPWAIMGWSRKQWKTHKIWKRAGVSEQTMIDFLQLVDHETIKELQDEAKVDLLVKQIFE